MTEADNVPVVITCSAFGYEETVSREVGLELADEEVLVFGNGSSGTPRMAALLGEIADEAAR
jgi:hypothetical protein